MPGKTLKSMLALVFGGLLLLVGFCYGSYFYALRQLPENTLPGTGNFPERVQKRFARLHGHDWPLKSEKLRPTFIFEDLLVEAISDTPALKSHQRSFVWQAGRVLLLQNPDYQKSNGKHVNEVAAGIWISRHWSTADTVNFLLSESSFGRAGQGLDTASLFYFNRFSHELRDDELDILFAIHMNGNFFDPWCRRERVEKFLTEKSGNKPNFDRLNTLNKTECKS